MKIVTQLDRLVARRFCVRKWEAEKYRGAVEQSYWQAVMLHGHRVGESVEATLCNLRELLDDVRRTQLETDPTKPKLDDQGKVIEEKPRSKAYRGVS